jgi:hypothetical protein
MQLRKPQSYLDHERENTWKLSYLRKNAFLGMFLGSTALGVYSLVWVPSLGLIVSGLLLGIAAYLASHPNFQQYFGVITLFVIAPSFLLFSISSAGLPRSLYLAQLLASTIAGLFGAPWLEQLGRKWFR